MERIKRIKMIACLIAGITLMSGCNGGTVKTTAPSDSTSTTSATSPTVSKGLDNTLPIPSVKASTTKYKVTDIKVADSVPAYKYNEKAANYFVDAAKGSDSNDGSVNKPFKTIKKAQEFVRTLLANMKSDIVINLRAGTYYLDSTLEFNAADSGKNGFNVVYRSYDSQHAVISGGKQVTGWTLFDKEKNIWQALSNGVVTRTFFVNDKRAVRARTALAKSSGTNLAKTDANNIVKQILPRDDGFTSADMNWANFKRQSDMEIVMIRSFHAPRVPLQSITAQNGYVLFKTTDEAWKILFGARAHAYGEDFHPALSLYYIENAYELLDESGEWYINKENNTVYYKPYNGEDMTKANAVLGNLEHIISANGSKDGQITNIRFDSIDFMHSTWDQASKPEGLVGIQAGFYKGDGKKISPTIGIRPSGALEFSFVKNISIVNCVLTHMGNSGIDFSTSTQNVTIAGNLITDVSGNGIMLGGHSNTTDYAPKADYLNIIKSTDNVITDNYIHDIAVEYYDSCAIVRGYMYNTQISYNTIADIPYTAMSIGWGWGMGGTEVEAKESKFPYGVFTGNSVINNYIYNSMTLLADGGSIYTLGRQDNMLIAGNYILKAGEQGIYLDNGSAKIIAKNNVLDQVYRHFVVRGFGNTVTDNYLTEAKDKDAIQPELGPSTVDTKNCSDTLRDSIIAGAGVRDMYKSLIK